MTYGGQRGSFQFDDNPFCKNAQSIGKIFCEVTILMKFLPTKPPNKCPNFLFKIDFFCYKK